MSRNSYPSRLNRMLKLLMRTPLTDKLPSVITNDFLDFSLCHIFTIIMRIMRIIVNYLLVQSFGSLYIFYMVRQYIIVIYFRLHY